MTTPDAYPTDSQAHTDSVAELPTTRSESKTIGGKLVGVSLVWATSLRPVGARIDGDFFATSDAVASRALRMLEGAIVQALADPHADALAALHAAVLPAWERCDAGQTLVGVALDAVVTAAARAYLAMAPGGAALEGTMPRLTTSRSTMPAVAAQQAEVTQSLSSRWNMTAWGIVSDSQPLAPARQMALDAQLAQRVADGELPPFLRFWRWGGKAIVLGAYQSEQAQVNVPAAREHGFEIVRRCTGGGTMVVEPAHTITYSLYAPLDFVRGLDPLHAYALCDEWIVLALRSLGVDARHEPVNDIASPAGKIGGGASRRFLPRAASAHPDTAGQNSDTANSNTVNFGVTRSDTANPDTANSTSSAPGCFLHHVTLAYDIDAATMVRVLRISAEKMRGKRVASAAKRVDPLRHQLAAAGNSLSRDATQSALRSFALSTLPGAHVMSLDEDTIEGKG